MDMEISFSEDSLCDNNKNYPSTSSSNNNYNSCDLQMSRRRQRSENIGSVTHMRSKKHQDNDGDAMNDHDYNNSCEQQQQQGPGAKRQRAFQVVPWWKTRKAQQQPSPSLLSCHVCQVPLHSAAAIATAILSQSASASVNVQSKFPNSNTRTLSQQQPSGMPVNSILQYLTKPSSSNRPSSLGVNSNNSQQQAASFLLPPLPLSDNDTLCASPSPSVVSSSSASSSSTLIQTPQLRNDHRSNPFAVAASSHPRRSDSFMTTTTEATKIESLPISFCHPSSFLAAALSPSSSRCTFCEHVTCLNCTKTCQSCKDVFCSFCAVTNYKMMATLGCSSDFAIQCLDCSRQTTTS